jgi:hypothetical protein
VALTYVSERDADRAEDGELKCGENAVQKGAQRPEAGAAVAFACAIGPVRVSEVRDGR